MKTPSLLLLLLLLFLPQLLGQQTPTEDPSVVFKRAQTALLDRDYASAEKGFQEVLRLDPRSGAAYSNLGVVYMRMGRYDFAIRAFQEAKEEMAKAENLQAAAREKQAEQFSGRLPSLALPAQEP